MSEFKDKLKGMVAKAKHDRRISIKHGDCRKACKELGFAVMGIDSDKNSVSISHQRVNAHVCTEEK